MNRIVVDASFSGAWLLPDETSPAAEKTLESVLLGEDALWVPSLWSYEMTNLLLSACRRQRIGRKEVKKGLELIDQLPIRYSEFPEFQSLERMAQFGLENQLSAYDAAYLELADRFKAPLYTNAMALRKAAKELHLLPDL